jgi:adenosylcobinamide-GDP ribazoletransferase
MWRSFLIAVSFLTLVPVPMRSEPKDRDIGYSLLFYPLVGLILGLLLAVLGWAIEGTADALRAALLLATWVILTGGLHLDGLADSTDAWLGGLGSRERTLAIMNDPYCGPAAVAALVVVLLIKFAALQALVADQDWRALVGVPVLGRAVLPLLFLTTPYLNSPGMGKVLAQHQPHRASTLVLAVTALALPLALGIRGLWLLLAVMALFWGLRTLMMQRLGGTTGDTAGALTELTETVALAVLALS